ncbi:Trm112 family protein [Kineosporia mesophila]|uniref:Trm112 family protein n=1 Tax=Kineosporia mesophila TaxID=566012 RepID=A0ABP6YW70_9ACTN
MREDDPVTAIESWLREILRCPSCRSALADGQGPDSTPELQCTGCSLAYRIDDGIPVLLVDEARTRS